MERKTKYGTEEPLKAIIFDNESVIVGIDWDKVSELASQAYEMPAYKGIEFKKMLQVPQIKGGRKTDTLSEYSSGRISGDQFYSAFLERLKVKPDRHKIGILEEAMEQLTTDADSDAINFLKKIKQEGKIKLLMLANTNPDSLRGNQRRQKYFDYFDLCYFSCEIGCRKPEPAAFQRILNSNYLHPYQYLFIDDKPENLEVAEAIGMRTLYHKIGSGKITEKLIHILGEK